MKTSRLIPQSFALISGLVFLALTLAPSPGVAEEVYLDFETIPGIPDPVPATLNTEVGNKYDSLLLNPKFGSIDPNEQTGPVFNDAVFGPTIKVRDMQRSVVNPVSTFNIALRLNGIADSVTVDVFTVFDDPFATVRMDAFLAGALVGSVTSPAPVVSSPFKGTLMLDNVDFDELHWEVSNNDVLPYINYSLAIDNLTYSVVSDPVELISAIIEQVITLNIQKGISNSLDAKLDTALTVLDDMNESNDGAACGSLGAFINTVLAQRGNKIDEADADQLITNAQAILDELACT